jgi:FMN phosphatase YigB (HAD superfamily)
MKRSMVMIFDLDGTVIDTSHRYRNLPCGKIDLDYWFANSTEEKIAQDNLLPLAAEMRRYYAEGHTVVVCTARSFFAQPDVPLPDPGATYRKFLADNDLRYHALLHRMMAGDDHLTMSDGDLKTRLLDDWAASESLPENWRRRAVMYDDNREVIKKMFRDRLICLDAVKHNARLAQRWHA